jgi:predicted GNAT family acetyltransferase
MASPPEPVRVTDNPDARRYEARVGDRVVGYVMYQLEPGRIVFTHTETDASAQGQGIGSLLAAGALDDARARGLSVTPRCPFIRSFIQRHPSYRDLVTGRPRP